MNEPFTIFGIRLLVLPIATAFAEAYPEVAASGFGGARDSNVQVEFDVTHQFADHDIRSGRLKVSSNTDGTGEGTYVVVDAPMPFDSYSRSDLQIQQNAPEFPREARLIEPLTKEPTK